MEHVEQNCTVEHEGRSFSAGGAVVTADRIIAYPGPDNVLQDWHGKALGRWKTVASWRRARWTPERMHQIEAVVVGVTYTGRGLGQGMIFRGRRKQRR